MGKRKKPDEEQSEEKEQEIDEEMLTPWQKENLKYMQQSGEQPVWVEPIEKDEESSPPEEEEGEIETSGEERSSPEEEIEEELPDEVKDLPKSQSFADKLPKMKKERRKRLHKQLTAIVGIFGISALVLIYYVSPISKLDKLEIEGNNKVSKQEIAKATKLKNNQFYWQAFFDKQIIPNVKKDVPRVKEVSKSISKINNIKLHVKEYKDIAYTKERETLHPVLENGKILSENIDKKNESFPILIGFSEGKPLIKLIEVYQKITPSIRKQIKEIHYTPSDSNKSRVRMYMEDGNQIIASTFDMLDKMDYYPKVVQDKSEQGLGNGVIDMEAGIYFTTFDTLKKQEEEKKEKEKAERVQQEEEQNDSEETNEEYNDN